MAFEIAVARVLEVVAFPPPDEPSPPLQLDEGRKGTEEPLGE
jgi:hypothetical protein